MLDLLIEILLAPLIIARVISQNLEPSSPYLLALTVFSWLAILAIIAFRLSFLDNDRLKELLADKTRTEHWPLFLQKGYLALCGAFEVGLLGVIANSAVRIVNAGNMPVLKISGDLSPGHVYVDETTKLVWLCDYMNVESSELLRAILAHRVSPIGGEYFSPGDLANTISIILFWWIALAIVCWAISYAIKELRRKNLKLFE